MVLLFEKNTRIYQKGFCYFCKSTGESSTKGEVYIKKFNNIAQNSIVLLSFKYLMSKYVQSACLTPYKWL